MTTTVLAPRTSVDAQRRTLAIPDRVLVLVVAGAALLPLLVRTSVIAAVVQAVGLLLVPGMCTASLVRLRSRGPVELLAVVVAGSIASDLVVFGALDILSLWVGWQRPLDQSSLQLQLSAFWLVLALAVHLCGGQIVMDIPSIGSADLLVLCGAASALIQAQVGAIVLNNGGPGGFAVGAYASVAVTFLLMVLLPQRPSQEVLKLCLVVLAVALLFSNSLRSPYLSGVDINFEYQVASMAQSAGVWDPSSLRDAYMACLSSSLFPVVFSNVSGLALMIVFKILTPMLFGLVAVFVFAIARHFVSQRGAVVATFFFLVQPAFQQWLTIPVRQEFALLLFAASLWALLESRLNRRARVTTFWMASVGLLLSHYSTIYIACLIYFLAIGLGFVRSRTGRSVRNETPVLRVTGVALLTLGAVLWYGPATTHTYALAEFVEHSATGLASVFDPSVQQQDQSLFQGFGVLGGSTPQDWVPTYVEETTREYRQEYGSAALLGPPRSAADVQSVDLSSSPAREPWFSLLNRMRALAKVISPIIIAVGVVSLWRGRHYSELAVALVASSLLVGLALVALPFISINYDLNRLYQQMLVLLAPMLVVGASNLLSRLRKRRTLYGSALVVVYFALLSRVTFQTVGGPDVSMTFNNHGWDYSIYYAHPQEVAAASWVTSRWEDEERRPLVFADSVAATRLRLVAPVDMMPKVRADLLPATFVRGSYLYLDQTNITQGGAVIRNWRGRTLALTVKQNYFDRHLDRVYSTSSTAVYR